MIKKLKYYWNMWRLRKKIKQNFEASSKVLASLKDL